MTEQEVEEKENKETVGRPSFAAIKALDI